MTTPGHAKTAAGPTLPDAMSDPALFGRWFAGDTWTPWKAFLGALFGLPLSEDDAMIVRACTGRQRLPDAPAREGWVIMTVWYSPEVRHLIREESELATGRRVRELIAFKLR